VKLTF